MNRKHLNLLVPQWQGSGPDYSIYHGAFVLRENYLKDVDMIQVPVADQPISPVKNDIMGYDEILAQLKAVNETLKSYKPDTVFTVGGGCDADLASMAYLNAAAKGDMALLYIDAHGDLNTPKSSNSKLFYGMSLRALLGDSDEEIVNHLESQLMPDQLVMCGNRALDPEEERYIREEGVLSLSVADIEADPAIAARKLKDKGYQNVYVHIDLDVLDAEDFPFAPVPEPDGLSLDTFIQMLKAVAEECHVVGLGLLEYSGTKESVRSEVLEEIIRIGTKLSS